MDGEQIDLAGFKRAMFIAGSNVLDVVCCDELPENAWLAYTTEGAWAFVDGKLFARWNRSTQAWDEENPIP